MNIVFPVLSHTSHTQVSLKIFVRNATVLYKILIIFLFFRHLTVSKFTNSAKIWVPSPLASHSLGPQARPQMTKSS